MYFIIISTTPFCRKNFRYNEAAPDIFWENKVFPLYNDKDKQKENR